MTVTDSAGLAIFTPTFEMMVICVFAASIPIAFVVWLKWWLGSVKDENPDEAVQAQQKADQEHLAHAGHGHGQHHAH